MQRSQCRRKQAQPHRQSRTRRTQTYRTRRTPRHPRKTAQKEARKLGWEGGPLQDFAPGKSIGGDHFGNYEGVLPEDAEYHECDIDTNGGSRGAKRLVWSDDWNIYYTDDHYGHFTQLYNADGPVSP